jgi:type II secretory pathway pseudopilin PulG
MLNRRTHLAFTLLEIMMALIMVAVLSLSLFESMKIAFAARRSAVDALEPVDGAHAAMEIIVRDLEAAPAPSGDLAGAMLGTDGNGDSGLPNDTLNFYTASGFIRPDYQDDQTNQGMTHQLNLNSNLRSPTQSKKVESDMQNVEYTLVADPVAGDMNLVRRVTRNLLSTVDPVAEETIICRHAASFDVAFYDGSGWLTEWDSTQNDNQLPVAIHIMLQVQRQPHAGSSSTDSSTTITSSSTSTPRYYTVTRTLLMPGAIGVQQQGTSVKKSSTGFSL